MNAYLKLAIGTAAMVLCFAINCAIMTCCTVLLVWLDLLDWLGDGLYHEAALLVLVLVLPAVFTYYQLGVVKRWVDSYEEGARSA